MSLCRRTAVGSYRAQLRAMNGDVCGADSFLRTCYTCATRVALEEVKKLFVMHGMRLLMLFVISFVCTLSSAKITAGL